MSCKCIFGTQLAKINLNSVFSHYYRKASGVMMVFDITDRESFESLEKWYEELSKYGEESAEIIVIGNKADLGAQRQVSSQEAIEFAKKLSSQYIETSV